MHCHRDICNLKDIHKGARNWKELLSRLLIYSMKLLQYKTVFSCSPPPLPPLPLFTLIDHWNIAHSQLVRTVCLENTSPSLTPTTPIFVLCLPSALNWYWHLCIGVWQRDAICEFMKLKIIKYENGFAKLMIFFNLFSVSLTFICTSFVPFCYQSQQYSFIGPILDGLPKPLVWLLPCQMYNLTGKIISTPCSDSTDFDYKKSTKSVQWSSLKYIVLI